MATTPEFVTFALDLLAPLGPVQARAMFGGHGLYCRGVMFGLLDDDELFLKTDEASRPRFVEAGCRRWFYGRMEATSYFRPPDAAHDDPEAMLPWARLALDAALRAQADKARRAARRKGGGAKVAEAAAAPPAKASREERRRAGAGAGSKARGTSRTPRRAR